MAQRGKRKSWGNNRPGAARENEGKGDFEWRKGYSELVKQHMPAHITGWVHNCTRDEDMPNIYNMLE